MVESSEQDEPSDDGEKTEADPVTEETQVYFNAGREETSNFTGTHPVRASGLIKIRN